MAHTAGPYFTAPDVDWPQDDIAICTSDTKQIAVVLGQDKEAQATAKLFVAAPDLLDATRALIHQLMRNASPRDPLAAAAVDIAILAIQKATQ